MQRIELQIMAIANSEQQPQSFVLILKELEGKRRLPVVIGSHEAQAIALAIEKITPSRPMTHDLLKNTMEAADATLKEIAITDLSDGIFFATLYWSLPDGRIIEVDARTSDAVALAVRFNCRIFTHSFILEEAGIEVEGQEKTTAKPVSLGEMTAQALQEQLDEALSQENYERAAAIRDEMKRRMQQQ